MKKNSARIFTLSLSTALLTAIAVSGVLLALQRMESTMSAGDYTLFSLEKQPGSHLSLTALGTEYDLDLSGVSHFEKKLSRLERSAAPNVRLFLEALSSFVNLLSGQNA